MSRFWKGRGGIGRAACFRSYLFGIAYNVLLADRRKAAHRSGDTLEIEPADWTTSDPHRDIWLRDALARLGEDDRDLIMLREYEQLSYQEMADLRQVPLNTIRSRLFRARLALKTALEERVPQAMRTTHGGS